MQCFFNELPHFRIFFPPPRRINPKYPHKIPFIPQKDGKLFEDFKTKLRKYNIESINVYLSDSLAHINEEKNEEKVLYIRYVFLYISY